MRAAAEACRRMAVEAVAVCLMHAFANPAHEQRVAEILRSALPGVAVTASSDVLPVVREYERSLLTVLNAVVMPGVATYVSRLQQRLTDEEGGRTVAANAVQWRRRGGSDHPPGTCADRVVRPGRRGCRRSGGRGSLWRGRI